MDYIFRNIVRFIATFLTFIPIANLYDFGFVDSIIIYRIKILNTDSLILTKYSLEFKTSICRVIPGKKI